MASGVTSGAQPGPQPHETLVLLQTFLVFCDLDRGASGAASDLSQLSLTTVGLSVLWSHRKARNHNSVKRVCPPYTEPRILRHDPKGKKETERYRVLKATLWTPGL